MSLITINDVAVIRGSITLPLQGVWSADLVIDQPDGTGFDPGTAVTIKADDGITLKGTVAPDRAGSFLDAVHVRVLAGKAGMAKKAQPRAYVQPGAYVKDVLTGILGDAGESLSSTVSTDIAQLSLPAWSVFSQSTGQAIGAFLDCVFPGQGWRMLEDGTFWTGTESWPSSTAAVDSMEHEPGEGEYVLGVSTLPFFVGVDLDGIGKVSRVEYEIDGRAVRAKVTVKADDEDRSLRGAISSIVRQEQAGIDFFALYDARIDSQSADGATVDLTPGDSRLPGMQRVPLRLGFPGCVAKLPAGSFVRLGWDRGDPRYPFACLFQGGEAVTEIQIAGSTYAAVLDTLITDLKNWVTAANTVLGGNCVNGAPLSTYAANATALAAFATSIGVPDAYKSTKLKHG